MNKIEQSKNESPALEASETFLTRRFSRRDLLGRAGQGAIGLTALVLCLEPLGIRKAYARPDGNRPGAGRGPKAGGGSRTLSGLGAPVVKTPVYLALPFWGDGDFGGAQYYQTIQAGRRAGINKTVQSADIDGDGQDELIGRNSGGIQVNQFDATTGQWQTMTSGPTLADYSLGANVFGQKFGWEEPAYYQTIQTGKINGGNKAVLIARDNTGIKAWEFTPYPNNPRQGTWTALPDGPAWHDFTVAHPLTTAWNQADCYTTIQCADIDGDGRDELIGRSADPASYQTGDPGLNVWKFDGANWTQMQSLKTMSDANGWNQPQNYSTIQCADIDGDGIAEVIGRDSAGLHVWKYYPNNGGWAKGIDQFDFSDANGWNQTPYYSTIQCADVDGDGQAEIVARSANGIVVYHHNKVTGELDLQSTFPDLADAHGWGAAENYSTIQCADFNGDGKAELIARSVYGIIAYEYNGSAWTQIADGPGWADDPNTSPDSTAWSKPQYYQTIQSARVKTVLGTRAIMVGKAAINVQSWTYNGGGWQQASLQFPQFISDGNSGSNADQQAKAYKYINANLTGIDPNQDIRAQYGVLDTGGIATWEKQLTDGTELTLAAPSGVSTSNPDNWTPVRNQIKKELDMVTNVLTVQTNMKAWYTTQLSLNVVTLGTVNGYLHADTTYTDNSNTLSIAEVFLSVFAAAINIAAAAFAPELIPEEVLALNITTQIMGAASSALTLIPTTDGGIDAGQPASLTYAEFSKALSDWAENVITAYDQNVVAIVQDYGLLLANGATDVTWDTKAADAAMVSARSAYELTLWKSMAPYVWFGGQALAFPPGYDSDSYGTEIIIPSQVQVDCWINADPNNYRTYPALATLQYLFGTFNPSPGDVILGGNGWTALAPYWFGPTPPTLSQAPLLSLHQITVTPSVVRNPVNGVLETTLLIHNGGTETETGVTVTSVQLGSRGPESGLPAAKLRLRAGQSHEHQSRFPASAGGAGSTAILRVQGKYKGGTFGGSFRVKLP